LGFFVRLLFAAYFLETGVILVVIPWLSYWDRNLFIQMMPALEDWLSSAYARGAVSGIGVVTAVAGIFELAAAFGVLRTAGPEHTKPGV
jgi:hypothetical protein